MSEGSTVKKRLLNVLRLGAAGLILVWVGTNLPWQDQLAFTAQDGSEHVLSGDIQGDWKNPEVLFRVEDRVELAAVFPEEARAATRRGEPFSVTRKLAKGPGFEWQPGMPRAFREMEPKGLLVALLLFFIAHLTIVTRWWRLLALAGCRTSWFNSFRLTFLGLFFNAVMPGQTGGDLVKGVVAAKENPKRQADAVVSVLVDRMFGLLALALLAMGVILAYGGPFIELRKFLLILLAAVAVAVGLYAAKPLRRVLGLTALVDRLPLAGKLRALDKAALHYLQHPVQVAVAFLFSFANHVLVVLAVFFLGLAIGVPAETVGLVDYLVLVPIANIVGAIPLAPGGWGLREVAYAQLFETVGANPGLGVAVSVTFQLCQTALGLIGAVFLLLPGSRAELKAADDVVQGSDA